MLYFINLFFNNNIWKFIIEFIIIMLDLLLFVINATYR